MKDGFGGAQAQCKTATMNLVEQRRMDERTGTARMAGEGGRAR